MRWSVPANGLEGFTVFETTAKPDLIITDMSMPVMDGFGLTQEIRRVSDVPIIVLSVRSGEPAKVDGTGRRRGRLRYQAVQYARAVSTCAGAIEKKSRGRS